MDYNLIKTAFFGLVGFRATTDYPLNATLLQSDSGRYFEDEDPFLTLANIDAVLPEGADINAKLTEIVNGSIIQVFEDWKTAKILKGSGRQLLAKDKMIKGVPDGTLTTWDKIRCLQFKTRDSQSLSYSLSLELHLTANTTVNLVVFDSETSLPVHTQALVYNIANSVQSFDISYTFKGQKTYYLCYDGAGIDAFNLMQGLTNTYFPKGKYFTAIGVRHDQPINQLWDLNENQYRTTDNFGMNLRVTATCDYTNLIIEQKDIFKNVLAKKVAINILNFLGANPSAEVNKKQANITPAKIHMRVYGNLNNQNQHLDNSLMKQYKDALKAVQFDESRIDKYCIKCKKGVKIGTY